MANYVIANHVSIAKSTYKNNANIVSVDLNNIEWNANDMTEAFSECYNLERVYVSWNKPISIDNNIFDKDKTTNKIQISLYVPQGKTEIYENADGWKNFYDIQEWDPSTPPTPEIEGDVNHDGVVDVADITATAGIILNNAKQEQEIGE